MKTLGRFQARCPTKRDSISVFAIWVFVICSWTMVWFLNKLPSWTLFLTLSDILGLFAYVQVFALFESAAAFLFIIFCWIVLPASLLGDDFVAQGSTLALTNVFWILVLHAIGGEIPKWDRAKVLLALVLYLASIGTSLALVRRSDRIAKLLQMLDDRVAIMLYIYVPLGVLSLILVLTRNVLEIG